MYMQNMPNNQNLQNNQNIQNNQNLMMGQQGSLIKKKHNLNFNCSLNITDVSNNQNFDCNEVNSITSLVICLYHERNVPLSKYIVDKLKNKYGGDWLVFVSNKNKKTGCSISSVTAKDFLTFCIGNSKFQIFRLK